MNKVILEGRLTKEIEIKSTPAGTPVCQFSIASNESWGKEKDQSRVSFFNLVAWDKKATALAQYTKKGQEMRFEGRLQQRRWQNDKGETRSIVEVVVTDFWFGNEAKHEGAPVPEERIYSQNKPEPVPDFNDPSMFRPDGETPFSTPFDDSNLF